MHYGLSIPNFGDYGDVCALVALAFEAEQAGWDGFFVWDHLEFARTTAHGRSLGCTDGHCLTHEPGSASAPW